MTTKITGGETIIGVALTSTFGTAALAGAGDRMLVSQFNQNRNVTVLNDNPLGAGQHMASTDSQQGGDSPTVGLTGDLRYNDPSLQILAQFFGGASVTNMATGYYAHSIVYNQTANSSFATIAGLVTSDGVMEFPSAACRDISIETTSFPGPLTLTLDLLADQRKITSTTNSAASLAATTIANKKRVIADQADAFKINAQAGAGLAAGDAKAIIKASVKFSKPQEHKPEMRNAAGNGAPVLTGTPPLSAQLEVTFKSLDDFTYFTAAGAGTAYKAAIEITDGADANYKYHICFPYLKVLQDPAYNVGSTADNEHTVVFECLKADTVPTGMIAACGGYPYLIAHNDRQTSALTVKA